MSQREQPDRACKSKRQVGVSVCSYTFGFSDSSSNSDNLSGSERRSSAPSPVCPLLSKSLTDSLIVGESCSNLADISHLLLSSPVSEGDNTVIEVLLPFLVSLFLISCLVVVVILPLSLLILTVLSLIICRRTSLIMIVGGRAM